MSQDLQYDMMQKFALNIVRIITLRVEPWIQPQKSLEYFIFQHFLLYLNNIFLSKHIYVIFICLNIINITYSKSRHRILMILHSIIKS